MFGFASLKLDGLVSGFRDAHVLRVLVLVLRQVVLVVRDEVVAHAGGLVDVGVVRESGEHVPGPVQLGSVGGLFAIGPGEAAADAHRSVQAEEVQLGAVQGATREGFGVCDWTGGEGTVGTVQVAGGGATTTRAGKDFDPIVVVDATACFPAGCCGRDFVRRWRRGSRDRVRARGGKIRAIGISGRFGGYAPHPSGASLNRPFACRKDICTGVGGA